MEEVPRIYEAPRNETEEKLVLIWEDVLGREKVGITDDFFELGGQSFKAVRIISQITKVFEININITDVLSNPTIEKISSIIRAEKWVEQSRDNKKENKNIIEV
jgi:acyl carrier protein